MRALRSAAVAAATAAITIGGAAAAAASSNQEGGAPNLWRIVKSVGPEPNFFPVFTGRDRRQPQERMSVNRLAERLAARL
jgi:hypothetical protein